MLGFLRVDTAVLHGKSASKTPGVPRLTKPPGRVAFSAVPLPAFLGRTRTADRGHRGSVILHRSKQLLVAWRMLGFGVPGQLSR